MLYHGGMTPCRDPQNFGPNWKPCDCPVHDQVAEMLGLVSTTGKDFRPGRFFPNSTSDDEALRIKHQQYLDAKLAEQRLNELRHQEQQPLKRDPLKALRQNKEIRAELLREPSFDSDVATAGHHHPQAPQTPPVPSCKACSSSRVREVVGRLHEASEATCGDCGHNGKIWMGQY